MFCICECVTQLPSQLGDKRIPEGPASSTARSLPPTTPSAPRAMASGDASRLRTDSASGREREWKRDQGLHPSSSGASIGGSGPTDIPPGTGGSLRSRISDKEAPRSLPQAPSSYRPELGNDRNGESSGRDDDRDGSRKRTLSGELYTQCCAGVSLTACTRTGEGRRRRNGHGCGANPAFEASSHPARPLHGHNLAWSS